MQRTAIATGLMLVVLCACQTAGVPQAPRSSDLAREIVRLDRPGPPEKPEGACWESDVTPAVIETVTEQVVVTPETRAEDGTVLTQASYRTDTRTRILQDREEVWFRAPCPADYTVGFVASLQRALKARGYYTLELTGQLDAGTRDAVRRYQTERGLDSARLSLAAARELGLLPTALEEL
ncbi:MAG: peptidoglycan-binding protein [Rhodobacter sp.]|nr:peptidoglycan-binding protein [Rhodobacter sp.]